MPDDVRFRLCSLFSAASAWSAGIDFLTHRFAIVNSHSESRHCVHPASFSGSRPGMASPAPAIDLDLRGRQARGRSRDAPRVARLSEDRVRLVTCPSHPAP